MATKLKFALAVAGLGLLLVSRAGGAGSAAVSDSVLTVPLPRAWSGSVGPGTQLVAGKPHAVAWILVGNFSFPSDAARHEGGPAVPAHKLLISLGDFVLSRQSRQWPRVGQLHLPQLRAGQRSASWNVRFGGRALRLNVRFGSPPLVAEVALTNRVLATVRRER